ncbi:hypothetical protein PGTUg99_000239 [Puccinia graminis f. sp. tritici]|uniref:Uncharacterized protein n=1 Tax=Puccinia graminis f. sp. tritici TaxID=56615 RepID=A0A5B0MLY0_PUCGR|nr:hypothetical protein PGTUg99_000239 [Puccinia graminis f. sp. tritici]
MSHSDEASADRRRLQQSSLPDVNTSEDMSPPTTSTTQPLPRMQQRAFRRLGHPGNGLQFF